MHTEIKRSAQSVLHRTSLPRSHADQIGALIANNLLLPGNFEKATARYQTTDALEIGERAAKEYIRLAKV